MTTLWPKCGCGVCIYKDEISIKIFWLWKNKKVKPNITVG